MIRSPGLSPPRAAGLFVVTLAINAPAGPLGPRAVSDLGRNSLQFSAKPGPHHGATAGLCRSHHDANHVRGNGKADTLRAARSREDRGIDADQLAVQIDKGSAGIARI